MFSRIKVATAALSSIFVVAAASPARSQFETRASVSTPGFEPVSVAVGDFNRDGNLDVAVVNDFPTGRVAIFLGNGDGTFRAGATYAVGVQPFYAAAADFRHIGVLDLAVSDTLSNNIYVMLGNGDGTFQPPVSYPATGESFIISTGDFTGDGKPDIVAITGSTQRNCVSVLPGNGDGTFGPAVNTPVPYNVSGVALAAGDFNGDGILDVAVPASFGSVDQVDILLGNGDGSFRADGFYPVSASPLSVAAGRFTGGRNIDLAVGNFEGGSISVLLGNGDGTFGQTVNYNTYFPTWVTAGDVKSDGKADLVVANLGSPGNLLAGTVSVLLGNSDGTFQPGVTYPAGKRLNYVAVGDFNNDGKPDLVAVDSLGEAIITLLNTGAATFFPTSPLSFSPQLVGTAGAPMDITLTNSGEKAITVSSVTISGQPFQITETTCQGNVPPGQHCTVAVSFTAKLRGPIGGTVTFKDSASSKPQVVELVGIGTVVKVSPTKLTFPPQKLGRASAPQTVQLTNTGSVPLNITKHFPFIYGKNNKDFSESSNCGSQVGPGASCTITVTFTPHQAGKRTAFVQIDDDGGGGSQNVPLTGTGID